MHFPVKKNKDRDVKIFWGDCYFLLLLPPLCFMILYGGEEDLTNHYQLLGRRLQSNRDKASSRLMNQYTGECGMQGGMLKNRIWVTKLSLYFDLNHKFNPLLRQCPCQMSLHNHKTHRKCYMSTWCSSIARGAAVRGVAAPDRSPYRSPGWQFNRLLFGPKNGPKNGPKVQFATSTCMNLFYSKEFQ